MSKHRVWLVGLVVAMTLMLTGAASAWEFTMTGNYTWLFETRSQTGRNGFFGAYDVDNGSGIAGTGIGFYAPVNGWIGELLGNFVSGTDGSRQVMWMTNDMDLRINPAVRVRGQYYIGEWGPVGQSPGLITDFGTGNLVASQYLNNRFPGIQRSFSPGYWNMLWLSAQLPWGEVVMGKRRSTFGMGMYYNGEESRSSESLALATNYGPFRFVISFYPSRRIDDTSNYSTAAPLAQNLGYFNQDGDKNNGRWWDTTIPSITYRSGDLDAGILWNPVRFHKGGEGIINTPGNRARVAYQDRAEQYGTAYVKYNNGRFFFNSEVDWYQRINNNRRRASASPTAGPDFAGSRNTYLENWRFATELGVLCGPSKLALLYAWAAGADRRRGAQIDRTGLVTNAGRASSSFSNTGLFRPYSYLAVYSYGLGTHINADTNNGYVEDASIWAARLDYAVASNLNVYGSFLWADRVSKSGWGWGFIRPVATTASADGNVQPGALVLTRDNARTGAPSIPDTNLGWEIDSGFDWKLLEGLVINATFAYWQPGNWYKFACVDKSVPNWATVTGGAVPALGGGNTNPALWGINPARSIDAIWGLELIVRADF
jgi:hypothetical protein